ncbi:permease prefix domain 1-containing protein [uncultured Dysosmobacter sp.]|uniref:permease prefix domain 1-containing protein n=1 Tax=uncultured Dysosmobacter sp. TaxID=2591384 RepID=UPI002629F802|nr:permease prefix domain 1-containing protein [uncultured Dysosmobacter sp.]
MPERKTIQEYLAAVEEQIRWKRARPVVALELKRHLEDQRDAFAEEGSAPEEAERLAVEEMGDPVSVGTELDRIHRPRPQWGLLLLTVALAVTGALLRVLLERAGVFSHIYAADPVRTAAALLLGTACLLGAYFLDYTWLVRHAGVVYVGTLLLTGAGLLLTPRYSGGRNYYAGYLVLLFPVVYAAWLYICRGKGWKGILLAALGGVLLAALTVVVPTTAGLLTLLLAGFALMVCAAGMDWFGVGRKKTVKATLGVTAALAIFSIWRGGLSLAERLTQLLHPELDASGAGYLSMSVKTSLGLSHLLGSADRETVSPYALGVLDWPQDFLLSEMVYKLGWLPFLALAAAIAALLVWLFRRCLRQRNQAGRLIALAVVMTLTIQAVFSLFMNMGYIIVANVCMPLLGGNLHTVIDMALIGLALSVFRGSSIVRESCPESTAPSMGEGRWPHWLAAPFRNI